ncbi:hypothetical protein VPG91_11335 [Nitrospirillum amazonense]|uniref:hypothetical protein n=1 Tax=Nitrospirillum amazonense TaxID=28077 RepID=UPI002DD44826|nr:hypothetical protein [Nitrospirillum amazonense]MEC4591581.1 hypothetical protein [Nitrospirillum amazonense]
MTERFISPCAAPEGLPREMLTILSEELAEIVEVAGLIATAAARAQVRASKALRFGLDEVQPGQPHTNAQRLGAELGDLLRVIERCIAFGIIPAEAVESTYASKAAKLAKFIQSAPAVSGSPYTHAQVVELVAAAREMSAHDGLSGSEDWHASKFFDARKRYWAALAPFMATGQGNRPPKTMKDMGYAHEYYMHPQCSMCGDKFVADRRAVTCEPCAQEALNKATGQGGAA